MEWEMRPGKGPSQTFCHRAYVLPEKTGFAPFSLVQVPMAERWPVRPTSTPSDFRCQKMIKPVGTATARWIGYRPAIIAMGRSAISARTRIITTACAKGHTRIPIGKGHEAPDLPRQPIPAEGLHTARETLFLVDPLAESKPTGQRAVCGGFHLQNRGNGELGNPSMAAGSAGKYRFNQRKRVREWMLKNSQ